MNTRLYLFEPNGSPNCPQNLTNGCFNTGLLEGCADPKQFERIEDVINYANSRHEALRMVKTADEAMTLCKAFPPSQTVIPPPLSVIPPRPQDVSPSATPPPMGGTVGNSLTIPPDTATEREFKMGDVYRLILQSERDGRIDIDTGATYPGCSRSNPDGCKPMQFRGADALAQAIEYSYANGEIPVGVNNVDEVWAIVEGKMPIQESSILSGGMSTTTIGLIAASIAAFFFLPKLFKGKKVL